MKKTFEIDGPLQLDIQLASGDIQIDAGSHGTAEVELTAHDEASQELVDAATVALRGRELIVDVPQRRGGFSISGLFGGRGISCRIVCPEGSAVKARTKSADLDVTGTLGGADVATASGDAKLDDVTGDLSFKGASGDVRVRDVGGRASVNTASGDIELGRVRGPVSANSASGDVSIAGADGDAKANTASGDVSLDAVLAGEVSVNSASGDVRLGIRRGSRAYLDCSTVSGDTRSELDVSGDEPQGDGPLVHVKARTVSGDITIVRAPAPAETQEVQA
jgi:DUF4097 and DUF4098 domain-containing protein YvlB